MGDLEKLRLELKRADDKYKALDKEGRAQVVSLLRAELVQKDEKLTSEDQKILNEFIAGNLQLDDLVVQFQGRI